MTELSLEGSVSIRQGRQVAKVYVSKINNICPLPVRMWLVDSDKNTNNGKNNSVYFFHLSGHLTLTMSEPVSSSPPCNNLMLVVTVPSISGSFKSRRKEMGDIIYTNLLAESKSSPTIPSKYPLMFNCLEPNSMTTLGCFSSFLRGDEKGRMPPGMCGKFINQQLVN